MVTAIRVTFKMAPFKDMASYKSKIWFILANLRRIS
jgi:hypothetical protein